MPGWPRVAVLARPENISKLGENVAVNRGADLLVTHERDKAGVSCCWGGSAYATSNTILLAFSMRDYTAITHDFCMAIPTPPVMRRRFSNLELSAENRRCPLVAYGSGDRGDLAQWPRPARMSRSGH
jgi:hypothetical protein